MKSRAGLDLPRLGQGTWRMGEDSCRRGEEVDALRLGLDLGLSLIDTAEMYGDGAAERVVAQAIDGRRDEVLLVSKVLPQNASRTGTLRAAERSLERLGTDRIDLYLLHWPGSHPLEETYGAFGQLVEEGKIRYYGVSNFDADAMLQSEGLPGGRGVAVNQVLYNLERRSIEYRLLPWCRERAVVVMAYSPFEQGRMREHAALRTVARRHGSKPCQVALAWTLRRPGVTAIPKAVRADHVRDNADAARIRLTPRDLSDLDGAYTPATADEPLDVL